MKLSSKPKPVRIRISVGGKEHTTLESLKENITPEILDFIDGRLERWLEHQGEKGIANKIKEISKLNSEEDKLIKTYRALLGNDKITLEECLKDLYNKDKERAKNFSLYVLDNCDNKSFFQNLFYNYFELFTENEWIKHTINIKDIDIQFELAKRVKKDKAKVIINSRIRSEIGFLRKDIEEWYNLHCNNRGIFNDLTDEVLNSIVEDWSKFTYLEQYKDIEKEGEVFLFIKGLNNIWKNNTYPLKTECKNIFSDSTILYYIKHLKDEMRAIRALTYIYAYRCRANSYEDGMLDFRAISNNFALKKKFAQLYRDINNRYVYSYTEDQIKTFTKELVKYILFEKFKDNE